MSIPRFFGVSEGEQSGIGLRLCCKVHRMEYALDEALEIHPIAAHSAVSQLNDLRQSPNRILSSSKVDHSQQILTLPLIRKFS